VSCRTVPAVDSNAICARFGGGGHRCAGGCHMHGELDDIMNRLTAAAAEEMKL
jgi:phosphoesterase RecJ-like protein